MVSTHPAPYLNERLPYASERLWITRPGAAYNACMAMGMGKYGVSYVTPPDRLRLIQRVAGPPYMRSTGLRSELNRYPSLLFGCFSCSCACRRGGVSVRFAQRQRGSVQKVIAAAFSSAPRTFWLRWAQSSQRLPAGRGAPARRRSAFRSSVHCRCTHSCRSVPTDGAVDGRVRGRRLLELRQY